MQYSEQLQQALEGWKEAAQPFTLLLAGQPAPVSMGQARANYTRFLQSLGSAEGTRSTDVDMGGVPGVMVEPESGPATDRVLMYFHGGGYLYGSAAGYVNIGALFAKKLRAKVFLPDFSLAPEHPFPRPVDDSVAAYRWLLDQGHAPERLGLAGDSAGGALTVSVMTRARKHGLPLPAAGVSVSPWANLEHTGASMSTREGLDPVVAKEQLNILARAVLQGQLPNDPEASPVFADVRGLPPILVQVGENEVMLSDVIRLASHLAENRVATTLEVWPGLFHCWPLFAGILPEAEEAVDHAVHFLELAFS